MKRAFVEQWKDIRDNVASVVGPKFVGELLDDFGKSYKDVMYREMGLYDADGKPYAPHSELYRLQRRNAVALKLAKQQPHLPWMELSGFAAQLPRFRHNVEKQGDKHRLFITYNLKGVEYMQYHLGQGAAADGSGGSPVHIPPIEAAPGKVLGPFVVQDQGVYTEKTRQRKWRGMKWKGTSTMQTGWKPTEFAFWRRTKGAILPIRRWWGPRQVAFKAGFQRMLKRLENAAKRINTEMKAA